MKKGGGVVKSPRRARVIVAGLAALLMVAPSRAAQSPAALRGNSVVLGWTDLVTWTDEAGNVKNKSDFITVKVYVSVQDRIFSSFEFRRIRGKRGLGGSDTEEVSGSDHNMLHWKFEDGALIADQNFGAHGARRVAVSFGDDFKQCSIKVIVAKEVGSQQIRNSGRSLADITISGESCAMQSGNVFADLAVN